MLLNVFVLGQSKKMSVVIVGEQLRANEHNSYEFLVFVDVRRFPIRVFADCSLSEFGFEPLKCLVGW